MSIRFSILIPAYNREQYIRQAIDSVLSQEFTSYELFVIDDGSTDKTLQILESYGTRIKLLRQANRGPEAARNKAAALARGEYLVFLDSDDLLLPGALATYDRVIGAFASPSLIIGGMIRFQDGFPPAVPQTDAPIQVLNFPDFLSNNARLWISSSRIVLKRPVFEEVGGLRDTTAKTFHLDSLNLMLKVGTYGPCVVIQQPDTVAYRHHQNNTIGNLTAITDGILALVRSEKRGEYPGGDERCIERYACIGGMVLNWSVKQLLRKGHVTLAFRLLFGAVPMTMAALRKKLNSRARKPTTPIAISVECQFGVEPENVNG